MYKDIAEIEIDNIEMLANSARAPISDGKAAEPETPMNCQNAKNETPFSLPILLLISPPIVISNPEPNHFLNLLS
jgi:hypothetical protein